MEGILIYHMKRNSKYATQSHDPIPNITDPSTNEYLLEQLEQQENTQRGFGVAHITLQKQLYTMKFAIF